MLSRRESIGRILTLVGLAAATGRGVAAETPAKATQTAVRYQDHPNNGQMCGMCKFYIPPGGHAGAGMMGGTMGPGMMGVGGCELVEGRINPMGWCVLYAPLSG